MSTEANNNMLNYKEEHIYCSACGGNGIRYVDRISMKVYLINKYSIPHPESGVKVWGIFRHAMKEYNIWKEDGTIPCLKCDGVGDWIERR